MNIFLGVDLGSSLVKVLHSSTVNVEPNYFTIEPEMILVEGHLLDKYRQPHFSPTVAEDYAFVGVGANYYAVGLLARKSFSSTPDLRLLKSSYAVQRILTAVWLAVVKSGGKIGEKGIKLFITCLLPPGELKDVHKMMNSLAEALTSFDTPLGVLQVNLRHFDCHPEGGGLALYYQQFHSQSKSRMLGVVMMGHRNTSVYQLNQGIAQNPRSSDLGFALVAKDIQQMTSGYKERDIVKATAKYLISGVTDVPDDKHLRKILLSIDSADREQELAKLIEAVASAKNAYWNSIKQWLTTQLDETTDLLVGGGTCRMFTSELRKYVCQLPEIVGKPESIYFLNAGLKYPSDALIPKELEDRYADVYCLWSLKLAPIASEYVKRNARKKSLF